MTIKDTDITRHGLRSAIAQVCLSIGWTSIHSQPLEILVDVLQRYIAHIGRSAQDRAELYGRTDPNMLDLSQVCQSLGVNISDLEGRALIAASTSPSMAALVSFDIKAAFPNLNHIYLKNCSSCCSEYHLVDVPQPHCPTTSWRSAF